MAAFVSGVLAVPLVISTVAVTPAYAVGGPPTLTSPTWPSSVPADGAIAVKGVGCGADSPVSFTVWRTTGGTPPITINSADSDVTADAAGRFRLRIPLGASFPVDAQLGVAASCTSTFAAEDSSDTLGDLNYIQVGAAAPFARVSAPARTKFRKPVTVRYWSSDAPGTVVLQLDGRTIATKDARSGPFTKKLPRRLSVGRHRLKVVFNPTYDAPTVRVAKGLKVRR